MTCKDCIHYDVCTFNLTGNENEKCLHFLDKANVVKVVRCKGCKHYVAEYCTRDIKSRTNMFYMAENDFCSYGERKEQE